MKDGIYSEQNCAICGGSLKDDGRRKVYVPGIPVRPPPRSFLYWHKTGKGGVKKGKKYGE